jgi:hypothetical protein
MDATPLARMSRMGRAVSGLLAADHQHSAATASRGRNSPPNDVAASTSEPAAAALSKASLIPR